MKRSKSQIQTDCRYHYEQEKRIRLSRREFLGSTGISLASLTTVSPLLTGLFNSTNAYAGTPAGVSIYNFQCSGGWASSKLMIPKVTEAMNNSDIVPTSIWQQRFSVSNSAEIFTGFGQVGSTPGPALFYKNTATTYANYFLKGILDQLDKDPATKDTIIKNFMPGVISTNTGNDNTPGVPGDFTSLVALLMQAASLKPLAAHGLGTNNTASGNGTGSAGWVSTALSRINAEGPVSNLLSMGSFCQSLSATEPQFQAFARRIEDFVGARLGALGSGSLATRFQAIHRAALVELKGKVAPDPLLSASALNPCNNALAKNILDIPAGTTPAQFAASTSADDRFKTMLYSGSLGNEGVTSASFGGMDYHGVPGGKTDVNSPDGRDYRVGVAVGMALRLAQLSGRPALFVITSDGGVRSTGNFDLAAGDTAAHFAGDDNRYCQWMLGFFKVGATATGSTEVNQLRWHVGKNSAATGSHIEGSFPSTSPRFAALIVGANIAYAMGLQSHFTQVALGAGFNQNDVAAALQMRFFG